MKFFFFRVTVPVEKCIQPEVPSLPRLLFRIFITVTFLTLTHPDIPAQPTQDFSRTSGKGCVGGNLTPPSGESAHQAIGKIKIVSDWQIEKMIQTDRWLKMQHTF